MDHKDVDPVAEKQLRHACAELDRRLRLTASREAGAPARAEDLLQEFPALASQEELALELIYTEFVTREELGEHAARDEYFRRFPQWRQGLRQQFHIHAVLNEDRIANAPTEFSGRGRRPAPSSLSATTMLIGPGGGGGHGTDGRQIGPYDLLEEVARGAMGVVYKARHRALQRTVALKMVLAGAHAGREELLRFRTEAEAIARLQHPNIVQLYEVGDIDGNPYLALEFVEGGSLAEMLAGQPQEARFAARMAQTLARAIRYAHRQGILHRDLKPGNILLAGVWGVGSGVSQGVPGSFLTPDPSPLTPKITDFGLAKLLDRNSAQTETGAVFGTPSYMAPEQAAGNTQDIGSGADVYALGAILYELLTGRPPFRAENLLNTLQQVVSQEPVPPDRLQPNVPRDLATICMKCLQKDPRRRYTGAGALAKDLTRFLEGVPILARPSGPCERAWKWAQRRPSVAALLGVMAAAALALLWVGLWYNARLHAALLEADQQRADAQAAAEVAQRKGLEAQDAAREAERGRIRFEGAAWQAQQKGAQAESAAREARRQQTKAVRQARLLAQKTDLLRKQFDYTRQLLYTMQLAQVGDTWTSNPGQALALLEDADRCPEDLRDFAWGLYHHLCKQDRLIAWEHTHPVVSAAFAPDGKTLATVGGDDDAVRLWDTTAGAERAALKGHQGQVVCLAFSPDGRHLVTGGEDKTLRVWLVATGKERAVFRGHHGGIRALAFAPDGNTLASGSDDKTVRLWDVASGKERLTLNGHTGAIWSLAFSPDGQVLASGSDDKTVRLWDLATLAPDRERSRFNIDDPGAVTCLAFSADGKKLAVAGTRRAAVDLFELDTFTKKGTFQGHVDQIHAIAFSPDGKLLATGSEDQTVRLWEVETAALRFTLKGHAGCIRCVAFAPDGQTLASAGDDNGIRLWSVSTRAAVYKKDQDLSRSWAAHIVAMAFTPDGKVLATGGHDQAVKLWDARTHQELARLRGHGSIIWALAFAPDNRTLATGGEDAQVKLWDITTRRELATLDGHARRIRSLAFSPDGKLLATASKDGTARLWDVAARRERATLKAEAAVFSVGFSPDGRTLAVGSDDGQVKLWDVATGRERATLLEHDKAVLFTEFSPDGTILVTGGLDNAMKLWDVDTFSLRATLPWSAGYAFSAAFTPDGKTLATGGGSRAGSQLPGEVKLWDVATGHCRATLAGQAGPVAFAPDGKTLATVNNYTAVKLWHSTLAARR
ncbi:MAG TPA: protein kinase [Gemmataceae bacterium]|jgi:WD40 repeat protein/serine/threonine protein kinase|nr:protein kinase [Gemmataceae bacterium]